MSESVKGFRRNFDTKFKLKVIDEAENSNNCCAARKHGVSEKNVRFWRKQKDALLTASSSRKSFRGPKIGRFKEIEDLVVKFIAENKNKGFCVTREAIMNKGHEIAEAKGIENFKGSSGWCRRMMKRNGLALRRCTTLAQHLTVDYEEKIIAFQKYVINLRKTHNYPLNRIGRAVQTTVFLYTASNTTVNTKGEKSVLIKPTGNEKAQVTVMLSALADGSKLPPFVILKRKTIPKETLPQNIVVRVNDKGCMDETLVRDCLKTVWSRKLGLRNQRSMLLLDGFRGHLSENVKSELNDLNTDLVIIPDGSTIQLKVLNVVNKAFKDILKETYNSWMLSNNNQLSATGRIKKPSMSLLCEWITKSWDSITPESIQKGFEKCCIRNTLEGNKDDILWEDESDNGENSSSSDDIGDHDSANSCVESE